MFDNPSSGRGRLSLSEYQRAIKDMRKLSDTSVEVGRLVLVEGKQQKFVAEAKGLTKARVSSIVGRILEEHDKILGNLKEKVDIVGADLDFAVHRLREMMGDQVRVTEPKASLTYVGTIVDRTDFYALQDVGRMDVVAHKLSQLDVAPSRGDKVSIGYGPDGRGQVVSRKGRDRSSGQER